MDDFDPHGFKRTPLTEPTESVIEMQRSLDQLGRVASLHPGSSSTSYELHRFRVRWGRFEFGRMRDKAFEVGDLIKVPVGDAVTVVQRRNGKVVDPFRRPFLQRAKIWLDRAQPFAVALCALELPVAPTTGQRLLLSACIALGCLSTLRLILKSERVGD